MAQNQNVHLLRGRTYLPQPVAGRVLTAVEVLGNLNPTPLLMGQTTASLRESTAPAVVSTDLMQPIGVKTILSADRPQAAVVGSLQVNLFDSVGRSLTKVVFAGNQVPNQLSYSAVNPAGELSGSLTTFTYGTDPGVVRGIEIEVSSSSLVRPFSEQVHGSTERYEEMTYGLHQSAISLGLTSFMQEAGNNPGIEQIHVGQAEVPLMRSIAHSLITMAASPPAIIDRAIDRGNP